MIAAEPAHTGAPPKRVRRAKPVLPRVKLRGDVAFTATAEWIAKHGDPASPTETNDTHSMMDGVRRYDPERRLAEAINQLAVTFDPTGRERPSAPIGYTTLLCVSQSFARAKRWEGDSQNDTARRGWAARYAVENQILVTETESLEKMGYPLDTARTAAWPIAYALVAAQWPQLADVCPNYSLAWVYEVLAHGKRNDTRTLDDKLFSPRAEYLWAGGFAPAG